MPGTSSLKLNQNECPFDLSPEERAGLVEAVRAVPLHRYPDPGHSALRERIAELNGVRPDMVVVGHGANEVLEWLIRATCRAGDQVLTAAPTYHLYDRFAAAHGVELAKVGWGRPFGSPRRELERAIGPRTRLLLLCRPNNPTGHLYPAADVLALAGGFAVVMAVDEAYYDFCQDTLVARLEEASNLVIVRTLSKAYGAAGLRLGYALARPPLAEAVRALQAPYAVSGLTQAAGAFLLSRPDLVARRRDAVAAHREDLRQALGGVPGVEVFPSSTNFVLVRTAFSADALDAHLRGRGILVRNLNWDDRHVRISVGTPGDHALLADAMREYAAAADGNPGPPPASP